MKLPGGYGGIVKLSGKRRRPYAVRKIKGYKKNGTPQYEYLGYFTNPKDANIFLAQYNEGKLTSANKPKTDITFRQLFDDWITEYEKYKKLVKRLMNPLLMHTTSFLFYMTDRLRFSK